ncbi:MAG TPA: DoxX family protein [Flavobacteriaceae bacterium]|nr:DoxX family protein [Flavobacteriaceae bacterium]
MKKLFKITKTSKNIDLALLLGRISIGLLMLVHGISKINGFSESPVQFFDFMGLGAEVSLGLAIFAEVGCSVLILFGLGTRFAVIPLIVTMLVAVLVVHGGDPFIKQEMGLHYLLVYIMLFLTGSGRYSLDQLIVSKIKHKESLN